MEAFDSLIVEYKKWFASYPGIVVVLTSLEEQVDGHPCNLMVLRKAVDEVEALRPSGKAESK